MKKTILYDKHIALNAKMSPFGGYQMPIQYESIVKEHEATRNRVTIFDTCHMGEFTIKGDGCIGDLEKILSCPVQTLKKGQCRYGFICNEQGGVIDDQILYRLGEHEFLMVVNASTEEKDFSWIKKHISASTILSNISAETAKLDLQGPLSGKIMQKLLKEPIADMKYYHFHYNYYKNEQILTSRTGYTGEIGFEIYCTPNLALQFWDDCLNLGVVPAGLGCRDTLRLEMGYPLYGHELDDNTNAAESGFSRAIAEKDFIGSAVICNRRNLHKRLVGITLDGRRTARNGDIILNSNGDAIGNITSGSFSPSLQCAIALGYVDIVNSKSENPVIIKTERNELSAKISEIPFYKQATGRDKLEKYL